MAETLKEQLATARTRMHPDGRPVDFWLERSKEVHSVNGDENHWLVGALEHFGTMEFYDFPIILGMSSSQLTLTVFIFQRGSYTNHQPVEWRSFSPPTYRSRKSITSHELPKGVTAGVAVSFGHGDFPEDGPPLITR
jgi:hypothetical protein